MTANWLKTSILGVALISVAACSSKDEEDVYVARDVEVLYNLGQDNLKKKRYQLAAYAFDEVERQHPYSVWARRAQLMAAYSHYMTNNYDDATLAAERFLQLHPGNRSAPYAYYLIALSHYEQISDVGRDQAQTLRAQSSLTEVIRRFPNTEYARDARLKLDLTLDHLAGKDMKVGRFYMKRQEYLAATMRFRNVVENYQTTSHTPEALHRLVESYLALGVYDEAKMAAAVLGHNYPSSKWYRYSYALLSGKDMKPEGKSGSWLSKLWPF
ncbi:MULTISPECIES: outer membrane protein assembly factor BamD [Kordiimonas]|jgi:outer membrane protein assembly factor BamD|uniref:Outer membrane protein assembly factor BamD n=1 Tax=Kordiimonas lacus TaxID=637679 RepID=A0A1G7D9J6_9PROT|nr:MULTISPECIES: outer membrane protein assembly factor BamD [Kordiimonas]SDE48227.1 Beta-barrel assembly machine subunit BamD [Kordiimonas lacus]